MTVSVIIPAYNEEQHIVPCLRALADQEVPADEVLVVDNNCVDRTAERARETGATVVREEMQGIAHARDRGFDAAKGKILARIDADTIVPPGWVRYIRSVFESGEIDGLTGPTIFHDIVFSRMWSRAHQLVYFDAFRLICGHETLFGSNMAITREIWRAVRDSVCSNDRKLHEDMDLGFHIWEKGGIIRFDSRMRASISARRIRKPFSLALEYPYRFARTVRRHWGGVARA